MNKVFANTGEIPLPSWSTRMCRFAKKVLAELNRNNWELSILLCNDKFIADLNARYRNKPEPTDILTFSLNTTIEKEGKTRLQTVFLPGDIVISLETLRENAKYFQTTEDEELRRLIIHGILHLDNMNHETNDKTEPMLELQERILTRLGTEHIITAETQKRRLKK